MTYTLSPIGVIHSPYKQKFGIPRQPGLVSVKSKIVMLSPYNDIDAFAGIEDFSHIWISFIFHQTAEKGWSPKVRPPRLGGNKRVGVFATRSTFRPNPLGLSVVKLVSVNQTANGVELLIEGADLLDQTPVLDIKPYLPYADSIESATSKLAPQKPDAPLKVEFSKRALFVLKQYENQLQDLTLTISDILSQDPRPAYQKETQPSREYGILLYWFDIRFTINGNTCQVTEIHDTSPP